MPPRAPKPSKSKPNHPSKPIGKPSKPSKPSTPANWPSDLPFFTTPRLSPSLTRPSTTPAIVALNLHARVPPNGPSLLVRIKQITDVGHPAFGQAGLFAARALQPWEWVIDYIGVYHTAEESSAASDYDISLDRESGVAVDAAVGGNEGRFVNDYRGVPGLGEGRRANVMFENRRVGGQERVAVRVGGREVKRGEELLVSYGKGFWEGRRD